MRYLRIVKCNSEWSSHKELGILTKSKFRLTMEILEFSFDRKLFSFSLKFLAFLRVYLAYASLVPYVGWKKVFCHLLKVHIQKFLLSGFEWFKRVFKAVSYVTQIKCKFPFIVLTISQLFNLNSCRESPNNEGKDFKKDLFEYIFYIKLNRFFMRRKAFYFYIYLPDNHSRSSHA